MDHTAQPVRLGDLTGSLKRHRSLVAVVALIGLLLGVVASFVLPSRYAATSTVSVNPLTATALDSSLGATRSVSMPTEAGVARSTKVAAAAAEANPSDGLTSAGRVLDSLQVDSPANSFLLRITFSDGNAKDAATGADAVAQAYLANRSADATAQMQRLITTTQEQIQAIQANADLPENAGSLEQQALSVQADALGAKLVQLTTVDLDPGQLVGAAEVPEQQSSPSVLKLGLAGLLLGLLAGVTLALRKKENRSDIGGVEDLQAIGDQIVLDGTKDTNRTDTWDIAAFMLKIPADIGIEDQFLIMVDAENQPGSPITPGQELVDALSRRGRSARFVDAGAVHGGKISRGWPTDRKRESWAGEIVVIDTSTVTSDANKVALATRSDAVLLARATTDDAAALRRLTGLLKSKRIDIALTALFPPRHGELSHFR